MSKTELEMPEYIWNDRVRHLGLPISFTRFRLGGDRLFCEKGLLNLKADEILLYRVRDLRLSMNLWQRIFGVGTVTVVSSDKSLPNLELKNVRHPRQVKELVHQQVEQAKEKRRMHSMEILDNDETVDAEADLDELD